VHFKKSGFVLNASASLLFNIALPTKLYTSGNKISRKQAENNPTAHEQQSIVRHLHLVLAHLPFLESSQLFMVG
jgi:hypothetical protein